MHLFNKIVFVNQDKRSVAELPPSSVVWGIFKEDSNGVVLPTFSICFRRMDNRVLNILLDNSYFQVFFSAEFSDGTRLGNMYELYPVEYFENTTNKGQLIVNGVLNTPSYVTEPHNTIVRASSAGAISKLPSISSKFKTIVDVRYDALDTTTWIQAGKTDRSQLIDILLHSNTKTGSSLVSGLTWDRKCIIKSTPLPKIDKPKYVFSVLGGSKKILCSITNKKYSGLRNSLLGNSITGVEYNSLIGDFTSFESKGIKSSLTRKTNIREVSKSAYQSINIQDTGYRHKYYSSRYHENISRLSNINKYGVEIHTLDKSPVQLLDLVSFEVGSEDSTGTTNVGLGVYIVTQKRIIFDADQIHFYYVLSRDQPTFE